MKKWLELIHSAWKSGSFLPFLSPASSPIAVDQDDLKNRMSPFVDRFANAPRN